MIKVFIYVCIKKKDKNENKGEIYSVDVHLSLVEATILINPGTE